MNDLAAYLKRTGTTQAAFAEKVGLTQATVSKLCHRSTGISLSAALRIERATDGAVPASSWHEGAA